MRRQAAHARRESLLSSTHTRPHLTSGIAWALALCGGGEGWSGALLSPSPLAGVRRTPTPRRNCSHHRRVSVDRARRRPIVARGVLVVLIGGEQNSTERAASGMLRHPGDEDVGGSSETTEAP